MKDSLESSWQMQRFLVNCIVGSGLPSQTPMGLALHSQISSSFSRNGFFSLSASLHRQKKPGGNSTDYTDHYCRLYISARLYLSRSAITSLRILGIYAQILKDSLTEQRSTGLDEGSGR